MKIVPQRLGLKFNLQRQPSLQPADIVPIFQRWIQERAVPGMLIDVIDYKHVPEGPGIVLIADEGDYGYDLSDGETGLQYIRKRALPGDLGDALRLTLEHAFVAARQLEAEAPDDILFDYAGVKISFIDRRQYPNSAESYAAVEADVAACLAEIYGGEVRVERRYDDPRELLCLTASVSGTVDPSAIEARLQELVGELEAAPG